MIVADSERLCWLLYVLEGAVWAAASLTSVGILIFRTKPFPEEKGDTKVIRERLHGQWYEIAGIHSVADQLFRSSLNSDSSGSNLSLQITHTGQQDLDFASISANTVEPGKAHQTMCGTFSPISNYACKIRVSLLSGRLILGINVEILHVSATEDILVWGNSADPNVVYVLSKDPRPTRRQMIPVLEHLVKRGFSLKKLKSIVQAPQKPSLSSHSTIRRFGVLTSSEMLIAKRLHHFLQVPTKDARSVGQRGNVERHVLDHSTERKRSIFAHSVNPGIFRNRKHPDLVSHAFDKFFDGCVRGNQRFVADFVDREFLWTVARDPKTLWSGLHYAAYNGYTELVEYFLEWSANSLANSIRGETPLMLAVLGMIRHVEERISWEDGTSCVYDLEEGDGFYSHKPHSLERYDETIRILLHLDPSVYMHEDKQGRSPSQVLKAARTDLAPRLKAHPDLAKYVERYFWRTETRFQRASVTATRPIPLDTDLKRAAGMLLWVLVRACSGLMHYFLKFVDALGLAIVLLGVGFFYWCIFQTAGHLLIRARIWVPLEARQRAAQTFSGDCALLIVLTVDSPVVTKFAQLLSGRVDLIPQAVADRLAFLQSRAPPMSPQEVEAALCRCYGEDRSHLFASFDMRPLAVGTVAQVHRAHLASSGEPVAVKIVKRSMRKGLDRYLFLLRTLSRLGVFGRSKVARLRVEHVTMMFRQQTDLNLEAASMQAMQREALRHRVRQEDRCHVPDFPQAYSLFTMENILVMDLIDDCVSLQDFLAKPSVPVKVMLARVGRIFYRSVMMDGLLHCDMHPGNIMVRPEDGRIVLLDFGLVGELTESERVALVAFHLASVSNEFVFAAEIFAENFVADVDGRLSDEDVRIRCLVSLGPVFGAHFGEFGGWDFVEFSVDLERVLKEFDVGVTSAWSILQMGIMHFRSTLALLQREGALRDVFLPFLLAEYDVLLGTLVGTKYHSKLEALVHRKFGWSLLFKSDRKLRAEQVYFEEGCK